MKLPAVPEAGPVEGDMDRPIFLNRPPLFQQLFVPGRVRICY